MNAFKITCVAIVLLIILAVIVWTIVELIDMIKENRARKNKKD